MPELISSEYCRENYRASTYCEIAMDSLYKVDHLHGIIKEKNYVSSTIEYAKEMEKYVITTVVFSAMCIESFFNNFAATELGDDEFYNNFDKLSLEGKFQLIAKFILKVKIDKGKSYYSLLKSLIEKRNSYIHNKSKEAKIMTYSDEEIKDFFDNWIDGIDESKAEFKQDIVSDYQQAVDALKAIRDIAIFFDENFTRKDALSFLFHPTALLINDPERNKITKRIYTLLKLKLTDDYEFQYNGKTIVKFKISKD